MSTQPEQIRRDIERTREELRGDVDALNDRVNPSRVVGRRVDKAKGVVRSVRERVMGSSEHPLRGGDGAVATLADKASSAADSVGATAQAAQQKVLSSAQGSPLAAGLIAFGAGVLISALLPASEPEQRLAGQLKQKVSEHADEVKEQPSQAVGEMREHLREPVQQAVESVKSSAAEAMPG